MSVWEVGLGSSPFATYTGMEGFRGTRRAGTIRIQNASEAGVGGGDASCYLYCVERLPESARAGTIGIRNDSETGVPLREVWQAKTSA